MQDLDRLKENGDVQGLINALSEEDKDLRYHAVLCIKDMCHKKEEKGWNFSLGDIGVALINTLKKEIDPSVRSEVKRTIIGDKQMEPPYEGIDITNPPSVRDKLLNAFLNSTGEIFDDFCGIVSNTYPEFIEEAFKKFKIRCPLHQGICSRTLFEANEIFVAHPFTIEMKDDLRRSINEAIEYALREFKPYYADEEIVSGDILCKICQKIQSSKFGIFEVSETCGACRKSNPNVTLELGLAYGFGKRALLICRRGSERSADIVRQDGIEYKSYADLKQKLEKHLKEWNAPQP